MNFYKNKNRLENKGIVLMEVIVFAGIVILVTTALVNWGALVLKTARGTDKSEQAMVIAESGIEYYRLHLLNSPFDYRDGTGDAGPYTHDYFNADDEVIGQYELTITAPISSSTPVIIKSTGTLVSDPAISRTIQVAYGIPSLTKYPIVDISNPSLTFGLNLSNLNPNILALQTLAESNGIFYEEETKGYHIVLKTNDTFDIYRITSLQSAHGGCNNDLNQNNSWGIWSINNQNFIENRSFPTNGIIFVDDNIWVDGNIDGAHITIVSSGNIIVNSNLTYTNYDGSDAIGLIAKNNIGVGLDSSDSLRIDAALEAINYRVGRPHFTEACDGTYRRTSLTLYGTIATHDSYGFSYNDDSGYASITKIYDNHLFYNLPPAFPLISNESQIMSWREIW